MKDNYDFSEAKRGIDALNFKGMYKIDMIQIWIIFLDAL